MENATELIKCLYQDFNARKIEAILPRLTEDVMWANGMEGGHIQGHKGLREYWKRQWAALNPKIQAVGFEQMENGSILVDARFSGECPGSQTERFTDLKVGHIFHFREGLIDRFDIQGRE